MLRKNARILFISIKHGIVVRGLERNLADEGYNVESISDKFEHIRSYAKGTDLFILYIPEDLLNEAEKREALETICAEIQFCGVQTLLIGEEKHKNAIEELFSELEAHRWLNIPVNGEELRRTVNSILLYGEEVDLKKRVLIVDDDPSYAGIVRNWLKEKYKVSIVTAGMQAITFLLKNPVDLILLDYEMPIVDGPQVLQMLRQEKATSKIPVVFLTGVSGKEDVTRVMELKPEGYILKTATKADILSYIKHVFE